MKNVLSIILCFVLANSFAQNKTIIEMVRENSGMELKINDLENYVVENINKKEQIAEFFYYWIGINIKYNREILEKNKTENEIENLSNPTVIFNERKGTCIGYSVLYEYFMDKFNIENEIVLGYAKNEKNLTVEPNLDSDFYHSWNAIKINGNWQLLDATWLSETKNTQLDYYFNIEPKKLILDHYPIDDEWQLLEKPLSLQQFNTQPYINSFYFQTGFPEIPILRSDEDYYYLDFKSNPNKNWLVKLTYRFEKSDYESVGPDYIKNEDGFTYKFGKDRIPKGSIIKMDLTDFNQNKQTMQTYQNIGLIIL